MNKDERNRSYSEIDTTTGNEENAGSEDIVGRERKRNIERKRERDRLTVFPLESKR